MSGKKIGIQDAVRFRELEVLAKNLAELKEQKMN